MRRWVVLGLCTLVFAILVDFTSLAQDVAAAKIPQQAFAALGKARQWRSDAILVMVEVNDYGGAGNFTIKFSFYSPADRTGLWVIATAQGSSLVSEAGAVNWGTLAIPQLFLDLPEAVQKARALGMQGKMDHAMLRASSYGLNWEITPVSDPNLRVFTIKANLGASSSQPLQLPQLTQAPQLVSDWRIVPGQRIGPVSLGMTPASALRALGQLSQKCTVDILNARKGTDTLYNTCEEAMQQRKLHAGEKNASGVQQRMSSTGSIRRALCHRWPAASIVERQSRLKLAQASILASTSRS